MWSDVVVLPTPVTDYHSCFGQGPQLFAVKTLFAKTGMKALDVSVLPRTTWFDIQSFDSLTGLPLTQVLFDKLRTIVATDSGTPYSSIRRAITR